MLKVNEDIAGYNSIPPNPHIATSNAQYDAAITGIGVRSSSDFPNTYYYNLSGM